ncbi:hypothetical protein MKW98_001484 [Papaver atlanticum]|uniref:THIF-type NAD/FAD binding fold domain-containing protein n=1 Tax=Papaver atlanticum TaxID=357466 RepID=A0AAD4SXW0_9MAGN|nr:hypothetical protein MKW98_001484 [Papaver atlanticum]
MTLIGGNVLISGMNGSGAEIAKSPILTGVISVTHHDEGTAELWDLSGNFIFADMDVGKNKALASVQKLQELNNAVALTTLTEKLSGNRKFNSGTGVIVLIFAKAVDFGTCDPRCTELKLLGMLGRDSRQLNTSHQDLLLVEHQKCILPVDHPEDILLLDLLISPLFPHHPLNINMEGEEVDCLHGIHQVSNLLQQALLLVGVLYQRSLLELMENSSPVKQVRCISCQHQGAEFSNSNLRGNIKEGRRNIWYRRQRSLHSSDSGSITRCKCTNSCRRKLVAVSRAESTGLFGFLVS